MEMETKLGKKGVVELQEAGVRLWRGQVSSSSSSRLLDWVKKTGGLESSGPCPGTPGKYWSWVVMSSWAECVGSGRLETDTGHMIRLLFHKDQRVLSGGAEHQLIPLERIPSVCVCVCVKQQQHSHMQNRPRLLAYKQLIAPKIKGSVWTPSMWDVVPIPWFCSR